MADYTEVDAPEGDAEGRVLETLANGMPYAFVVATSLDPLNLRVGSPYGVETLRALLTQTLRALPGGAEKISDGYHTFQDLYDHRRALTAVLAAGAASAGDSWRSKRHHPEDGPMFDESFIVGLNLPVHGTITYHYNLEHWDDFAAVPELEHAPKWDGAGPDETVSRLLGVAHLVAQKQEAGK
jgi:hypothetical protein